LSSILAASDLMSMMFEAPLSGVMDPMVAKEARKSTQ
jgi:hypothetical protein